MLNKSNYNVLKQIKETGINVNGEQIESVGTVDKLGSTLDIQNKIENDVY